MLAGCGGGDDDSPPAAQTANITSFRFMPDPIRVKAGGTVTWVNNDKAPHTAQTDGRGFDTDRLDLGERRRVKLDRPGTYRYFCVYHRFMEGTVEVVE